MSVRLSEAEWEPSAAGVNVTLMFALALGATVMGVALDEANSALLAPVIEIADITRLELPLFVMLTFRAVLVVPTS